MSGVFRTLAPPPPLHLASVSSPRIKGGGVKLSEDARLGIGLLQYNPSTCRTIQALYGWEIHKTIKHFRNFFISFICNNIVPCNNLTHYVVFVSQQFFISRRNCYSFIVFNQKQCNLRSNYLENVTFIISNVICIVINETISITSQLFPLHKIDLLFNFCKSIWKLTFSIFVLFLIYLQSSYSKLVL